MLPASRAFELAAGFGHRSLRLENQNLFPPHQSMSPTALATSRRLSSACLCAFASIPISIINADVSPLQAPVFAGDRAVQLGATALGVLWSSEARRVGKEGVSA